jgi:hypothetical protein
MSIIGYRTLSEEEINLINEVKTKGNEIGELIEKIRQIPDVDLRWVATGTTDIQKGIMSVIRGIAKPDSF